MTKLARTPLFRVFRVFRVFRDSDPFRAFRDSDARYRYQTETPLLIRNPHPTKNPRVFRVFRDSDIFRGED